MGTLTRRGAAALGIALLLLAVGGLYLLDRYNVPSWMITKYHKYSKQLRLTLKPIVVTDRMVLEPLAASGLVPRNVADAVGAGHFDEAWEYYRVWRSKSAAGDVLPPESAPEFAVRHASELADDLFYVFGKGPYRLGQDFTWTEFPPGKGDVVYVWDLNTLRHFAPLAQAYVSTGDARFAEAISRQLASWQAQNPIDNSVSWRAPMEASLRLSTFCWVTRAMAPHLDAPLYAELVKAMYGHARFIARYIDAPRKINNHAIFAAIGLYLFAVQYPEFPEAAGWKLLSEKRLLDELDSQYTKAGVHKENASHYHKALTDVYLHYLIAKMRLGEPAPPEVMARIAGQLRFLQGVTGADGELFRIGDSSDALFLELGGAVFDTGPTLHLGALLLSRPEYAVPTPAARRAAKWALGEPLYTTLAQQLEQARPRPLRADLSTWPESGFFRIDSAGTTLFGDLGPIGGAPHLAGHDHADTTSFVFWRDGEPLVIDPGTYVYPGHVKSGEVVWRVYMRSTAAHNAVTVDGLSQAIPAPGNFGYQSRPAAHLLFAGAEGDLFAVGGEHFAYREQVGATRRIFVLLAGDLLVLDWFPQGTGSHDYMTTLNLPVKSEGEKKRRRRLLGKRDKGPVKVLWSAEAGGNTGGRQVARRFPGAISRGYGSLTASSVVRRRTTHDGPVVQAFSLIRKPDIPSVPKVTALADGGFAVTARLGETPVTVLLAGGEEGAAFEGWSTDAKVAVFATDPGGRALVFGGTAVLAPEGKTPPRTKVLPPLNPDGASTDKESGDK